MRWACHAASLARITGNLRNMLDRSPLARVLAIHNGKGGAIKTSIATNLAGIVAEAGYRVLLVDLDPQGNCGEDLGYTDQADDGELLRTALESGAPLRPTLVARERLDVTAGGPALRDIKIRPGQNVFDMLAASLIPEAEEYDLVILDTPPGGSSTIEMALGAARYLIIPSPPDRSSIKGLEFVAQSIEEARRDNPMLTLLGALLVQVASNATTIRSNAIDGLTQSLGDPSLMFRTSIRYAAKTAQEARDRGLLAHELAAVQQGRPFWEFLQSGQKVPDRVQSAPGLASDYVTMTDEVLERIYDEEKRLAEYEEEQQ
jgi:chromosome partitioning protein